MIDILAFIIACLFMSVVWFCIPVLPALGRLLVRLWVHMFVTGANRLTAWLDARCQQ